MILEPLMNEENKITLPVELQRQMLKFFWETSIPRKKREQQEKARALSENQNTDGGEKNGDVDGDLC